MGSEKKFEAILRQEDLILYGTLVSILYFGHKKVGSGFECGSRLNESWIRNTRGVHVRVLAVIILFKF
jgi:hypothetical protein